MIAKALTIAGSDSGGGAGIQADLKTFSAFKVYGSSVITALTAQNTLGVHDSVGVDPEFVIEQIHAVFNDIGADAVKTGMLFSSPIVVHVSRKIAELNIPKLVVDPVMIAKGGSPLVSEEGIKMVRERLVPLAFLVTPNIPEAEVLAQMKIVSRDDRIGAAEKIHRLGADYVLIKGGHAEGDAEDLLFDGQSVKPFSTVRIDSLNTHGTGCTLSAAITACLAKGYPVDKSVKIAKNFVTEAIRYAYDIGAGHGPLNHFVDFREE